jgi:NitT/TauT family transport system substrate-binding protein
MRSTSTRRYYQRAVLWVIVLTTGVSLAGCGASTAQPTASVAVADPVSIQLSWTHTIEWAGFYIAEADGHYRQQRLAVTLKAGGTDAQGAYIDPITSVVSGTADFGITSGSNILQSRAAGQPVVAVASIYQRHPLALTSLAEKKIVRPQDLYGKIIHVSPVSRYLIEALIVAQGLDQSRITIRDRADYTVQPLLTGEADVIDGWVTNEVATLTREGHAVNLILPSDYGIEEYPNVLFTTERMISERPDLIERLLRATFAGWTEAIAHPERAAPLALAHDATLNQEDQRQGMLQSLPLISLPGSPPGTMTPAVWESTARILWEQDLLPKTEKPDSAYTLTFMTRIAP